MESDPRSFGWELCIDLYDCDESICDRAHIEQFIIDLCDDVLKMGRYGSPFIERFALHDPKVAGYSAVQLIETSSIVCHFAEASRSAFFDVFSCKEFDENAVTKFCEATFGGRCVASRLLERGRRD